MFFSLELWCRDYRKMMLMKLCKSVSFLKLPITVNNCITSLKSEASDNLRTHL